MIIFKIAVSEVSFKNFITIIEYPINNEAALQIYHLK